ncbi:MAG TPA: L,D-transpeptidase [Caulobacteraceae bacterium]|nr:L,D-transpeptidase [Caulobacteraceae bacterium]
MSDLAAGRPARPKSARLWIVGLLAALALISPAAWADPPGKSAVVGADIATLKPGEFIWAPRLAPAGPMVMLISLKTQQAYVYRNGVRIGVSTISTGRPGRETPTGVFTVLEKHRYHRSNLYSNAPMPFMQRLTWGGVALHAGVLPGYAASHGCIRLPYAFARDLFAETATGMTVIITSEPEQPTELAGGDLLSPAPPQGADASGPSESFTWRPERAPFGPVTILLSSLDQRLIVLRNGKLIGSGQASVPPGRLVGTHALEFNGLDPQGRSRWIYIAIPGAEAEGGTSPDISGASELQISPEYLRLVRSVLTPGATLLATDGSLAGGGAGKALMLIESERP